MGVTGLASLNRFLSYPRTILVESREGVRDVVVSMIPQIVGVITGFLSSVLIARGLGPNGLGQYALVMSLVGVAAVLSDLGINQTAVRFAARAATLGERESQMSVLRWAFRVRMTLVAIVTFAFFLVAPLVAKHLWQSPDLIGLMQFGLLGGVFTALSAIPSVYFQSEKRFTVNAAVASAQKVLAFGGILILALLKQWSIFFILAVAMISSAFTSIVFLRLVPKRALWRPKELRSRSQKGWDSFFGAPQPREQTASQYDTDTPSSFAFYQLLSSVIVMLTLQVDIWLMGVFLDKTQIGLYSAAVQFTLPLTIVLGAVNTALWPRASSCVTSQQAVTLLRKTFSFSALVALLGAIYALFIPLLAPRLFGQNYASSSHIGQLLCLGYCVAILGCPVGIVGYSFGMARVNWLINLLQFAVVLCLLWALLPFGGPISAAYVFIVNATLGIGISMLVILRRSRRASPGVSHVP